MDQAVANYIAQGWSVESRSETQVVLARKKRIGWFWNILLTCVTVLWGIVLIYKIVNRKIEHVVLTLDPSGQVRTKEY